MSLNVLTNYQTEEVISLHYHCLEIDVNGCEMDVNKKKTQPSVSSGRMYCTLSAQANKLTSFTTLLVRP